ncbi:MAG: hypothetical protein V3V08_17245 [Nannocystaceae bacterium]
MSTHISQIGTSCLFSLCLGLGLTATACDSTTTSERSAEAEADGHSHAKGDAHSHAKGDAHDHAKAHNHGDSDGHHKGKKHGHHGSAGKHGHADPGEHARLLQEKLSLSDKQTETARAIFAEFQPQTKAMHDRIQGLHEDMKAVRSGEPSEPGDRDARREEMKEIYAEKQRLADAQSARIKATLTAEQAVAFEKVMESHGRHECSGDCGGGACPHAEGASGGCPHSEGGGECPHAKGRDHAHGEGESHPNPH